MYKCCIVEIESDLANFENAEECVWKICMFLDASWHGGYYTFSHEHDETALRLVKRMLLDTSKVREAVPHAIYANIGQAWPWVTSLYVFENARLCEHSPFSHDTHFIERPVVLLEIQSRKLTQLCDGPLTSERS